MNKMLEGHKSESELGLSMLAFEIEQAKAYVQHRRMFH